MGKKICEFMISKRINENRGIVQLMTISGKKHPPKNTKKLSKLDLFINEQRQANQTFYNLFQQVLKRLENVEIKIETIVKLNDLKTE